MAPRLIARSIRTSSCVMCAGASRRSASDAVRHRNRVRSTALFLPLFKGYGAAAVPDLSGSGIEGA
jgi:hypothetical protein